MVCDEFVFFFV